MKEKLLTWILIMGSLGGGLLAASPDAAAADGSALANVKPFPRGLDSYADQNLTGITEILRQRISESPFNLVASLIFFGAIIHTFLASKFNHMAHVWESRHQELIKQKKVPRNSVHHGAELFHFLGEIEVVFGLWAIVSMIAVVIFHDWGTAVNYLSHQVNFTEPLFVVTIMILASTRPVLKFSELVVRRIADLLGGTLTAWWLTILTLGPLLGSFITEPGAMTICAMLLANKLYVLQPTEKLKYATLGLLFVNISVGGTLTHFAAPPVLMVAGPWNWDIAHMLVNFGWKVTIGIVIANSVYYFFFRNEMARLQEKFVLRSLKEEIQRKFITRQRLEMEFEKISPEVNQELGFFESFRARSDELIDRIKQRLEPQYLKDVQAEGYDASQAKEAFDQRFEEIKRNKMRTLLPGLLREHDRPRIVDREWDKRDDPVPAWVTFVHAVFMLWTIVNAHHPVLFISGLLFFLGFAQVTSPYQNHIHLKTPMLVGFFLAGLVTHGGLQGWWIQPVLSSMSEVPLMLGSAVLTAFNDNAAITFLATLVPGFTDSLKYAVVAGAVAGGGLTVIANAPNPAGQSILKDYFENGISPLGLLKAALPPTLIMLALLLLFR